MQHFIQIITNNWLSSCARIETAIFSNWYSLKHYTLLQDLTKNIWRTELYYDGSNIILVNTLKIWSIHELSMYISWIGCYDAAKKSFEYTISNPCIDY